MYVANKDENKIKDFLSDRTFKIKSTLPILLFLITWLKIMVICLNS